jgi:hypothetical protein
MAIRPSGYFACVFHDAHAHKPAQREYFSARFSQAIQTV